ncbi:hypothetical protein [Kaarinaea lacus]
MYEKQLQIVTVDTAETTMTKEERYELIALIAQRVNEFKGSADTEERSIWDSSDIEINFDDFVSHYN